MPLTADDIEILNDRITMARKLGLPYVSISTDQLELLVDDLDAALAIAKRPVSHALIEHCGCEHPMYKTSDWVCTVCGLPVR